MSADITRQEPPEVTRARGRRMAERVGRHLRPAATRIVAMLVSLFVVAVVFLVAGYPLGDVASGIWAGAFGAPGAWQSTLRWSMAYAVIGAGVLVAIRSGFFNVGAQGQFYLGACASVAVALAWSSGPPVLVILAATAAGIAAGGLWALGPGWLRVRFGTDEVITTLMANFVALLVLRYLTSGPLQDPSGSGESSSSESVDAALRISDGSGVSWITVGITVLVLVGTWILITRTRFGLLSGIAGRNPLMARWQGVNVARVGLVSFAVSGAAAGLFGAMEVLGAGGRISSGFAPGLGFTAILVAVVGGLGVGGLIASAVFFGALQAALLYLPIVTDVPPSSLDLLRGMVALLITITPLSALIVMRGRLRRGEDART